MTPKEKQQDAENGQQQGPKERSPRNVHLVREEAERLRTRLVAFFSVLLGPGQFGDDRRVV